MLLFNHTQNVISFWGQKFWKKIIPFFVNKNEFTACHLRARFLVVHNFLRCHCLYVLSSGIFHILWIEIRDSECMEIT